MVPTQSFNLTEITAIPQASLTYALDLKNKRINNMVNNQEALNQAVIKRLNTEKYSAVIYSSQYGVELERLIGKDYDFIYSDLERTITEALLMDDRILSVSDFLIEKSSLDALRVTFSVNSIYGAVSIEYEVQIL